MAQLSKAVMPSLVYAMVGLTSLFLFVVQLFLNLLFAVSMLGMLVAFTMLL